MAFFDGYTATDVSKVEIDTTRGLTACTHVIMLAKLSQVTDKSASRSIRLVLVNPVESRLN
ncbi:MAG: hypothetical protein SGI77_01310 [Pirellulaceae bacterium]|nr:hypothetical protein [Pirellulaceae bacterium]